MRTLDAFRREAATLVLAAAFAAVPAARAQVWRFDQLQSIGGHTVEQIGSPQVVQTPIGAAIAFNGKDTGLRIGDDPLAGAAAWTWEMIFRPAADGPTAQRIFHLQAPGIVRDPVTHHDITDRLLFEIRIVNGSWCLDSFASSGGQHATLLDCTKLHPLGRFYRVAAVYDGTTLRNYVDGEEQGETVVKLAPQPPGQASIGVRMDLRDWFKGEIYEARFTRHALPVSDFLPLRAESAAQQR